MVATPLPPNASPAPSIVTNGSGRPRRSIRYGSMLAAASAPSATASVGHDACVIERAGAQSPAPATPTMIAPTARYSRRPARSPSIR